MIDPADILAIKRAFDTLGRDGALAASTGRPPTSGVETGAAPAIEPRTEVGGAAPSSQGCTTRVTPSRR